MNIKDISALADIMESKGITNLKIEEDGVKIEMDRQASVVAVPNAVQHQAPSVVPRIVGAPNAELNPVEEGNVIKSPTVGVYYASSSPDSDPFVEVGTMVKKGDVLCIIEAMKLMNEITSDVDGEVIEVCIGNGQVVEYDQPLFKIK